AFHPRCPLAVERCRIEVPPLVAMADGRVVACHVRAPATDIAAPPAAGARMAPERSVS
ncbi:MAG: oligopeptide ABC transporter ATP-binding protein, partial [Mesorhizobium sp.]